MRKVFFLFLLCITFFSGCVKNAEAPDETAEFPDAVKLSSEIKYFNDYLGISCAVPMVDYWPQNARAKQSVIDTVAKSIAFY